jgi:alpha-galactosidase
MSAHAPIGELRLRQPVRRELPAGKLQSPRINGPRAIGCRPGSPIDFRIAATGSQPMQFRAGELPPGLHLDHATGRLTGVMNSPASFAIRIVAENAAGVCRRDLRVVVGDAIALTPPMGWSSWNCWGRDVDQEKVIAAAEALVRTGLADHGWTYVNIDDGWQGQRDPVTGAIMPNEKFSDMAGLCKHVHDLGLKIGIYSTPWVKSYAGFTGGSADESGGPIVAGDDGRRFGDFSYVAADVAQWVAWGIDYLKYDWYPIDIPATKAISNALRGCGRDIVLSLSNSAPLKLAGELSKLAECWRTTGDVCDLWTTPENAQPWEHSVSEIGFGQAAWASYAGPGHWNDADMLVVGHVGWGPAVRPTRLTPDEQRSHISLWCLLASPLLLGCDLDRINPFTLGLLTNDEVLDINQDPLGLGGVQICRDGETEIWMRELENGDRAVGLFNLGETSRVLKVDWQELRIAGPHAVRDLWETVNLQVCDEQLESLTLSHGVTFVRLSRCVD